MPNPPLGEGRYHVARGTPTWYGSSTEAGAWAEFARSAPTGVDLRSARRRLGRVTFDVVALDLTNPSVIGALGISRADLVSDDRIVCQQLAETAVDTGFDAIIAPSAAVDGAMTLAVFGDAIKSKATKVEDLGVRRFPAS